jgi:hypothetical protein
MTIRTGRMKVRLPNGDNPNAYRDHAAISKAVDDELAKSGERLVRLLGDHWTGFAEGPTSPWIVYSVDYEAGPRD